MKRFLLLILAGLPLLLPAQSLDSLAAELKEAVSRKRQEDAVAISDKILAGDVVAHFVQGDSRTLDDAIRALAKAGVLGTRIEDWEAERSAQPKSERLNLLLASAYSIQEYENTEGSRIMGELAPGRLKIRREGPRLISEFFNRHGKWQVMQSEIIPMPRKVLAGIVVSSGTARLKMPILTVAGQAVPLPPWKTAQIGRPVSRGKLSEDGGSLLISGAGFPLNERPNDDVVFAWQEVEGDFVLETTVEELLGANSPASAGLAVRASLDPAAPFLSIAFWTDGLAKYCRKQPGRAAEYWKALCASRPGDPAFVQVCLREMLARWMNEEAKIAAERLIASGADPKALDDEIFGRIYGRIGLESPLRQARLGSVDSGDVHTRAQLLLEQARHFQSHGQQEQAVAAWKEARALMPGETLPMVEHRQLLISLRNLERKEEWQAEVKRFFIGAPGGRSGSPSEMMMSEVMIGTPCLGPTFLPVFREAVNAGLAVEIAKDLERANGSSGQRDAARGVATALRIAARDPEALPPGGPQGNALPKMLNSLSPQGLALAAYVLQQTPEGRPMAVKCLERVLNSPNRDRQALSKEAILAWKMRLDGLLGDTRAAESDLKEIANELPSRGKNDPSEAAPIIRKLIRAKDLDPAEKVANGLKDEKSPFDPASDALGLLELSRGRGMPMPVLWSQPEGDEVRIFWEFAPDNWGPQPLREVRAQGAGLPAQNGKYSLDIYAERGKSFGKDMAREDLLLSLPQVESSGSWKGKFPADRSWIAAALRKDGIENKRSPSVPAAVGSNLLSPFNGEKLQAGEGDWATPVKWYWTAPLPAAFPKGGWMISRLQHDTGSIFIDHRPVPIDPNREYTFSGWLKTDHGMEELTNIHGYPAEAALGVLFYDAKGNQLADFMEPPTIGARWTLIFAKFGPRNTGGMIQIPRNAATAMVRLKVSTQCEIGQVGFYQSAVPPK